MVKATQGDFVLHAVAVEALEIGACGRGRSEAESLRGRSIITAEPQSLNQPLGSSRVSDLFWGDPEELGLYTHHNWFLGKVALCSGIKPGCC